MAKRSKRAGDFSQVAREIVQEATQADDTSDANGSSGRREKTAEEKARIRARADAARRRFDRGLLSDDTAHLQEQVSRRRNLTAL